MAQNQTKMYLLLLSGEGGLDTRAYHAFDTKQEITSAIIQFYEDYLQSYEQKDEDMIEFSSDELFEFMDKNFVELVLLQKDNRTEDLWVPLSTAWIKEAIYLSLRESCATC